MQGNFLTILLSIGCLIALCSVPHDHGRNDGKRFALLMLFGAFNGLAMGPLLDLAVSIDQEFVFEGVFVLVL